MKYLHNVLMFPALSQKNIRSNKAPNAKSRSLRNSLILCNGQIVPQHKMLTYTLYF